MGHELITMGRVGVDLYPEQTGVALKGPITTPVGEGFRSVNVTLRQALGLYANLRPVTIHPALVPASPLRPELLDGVDLLIVRELTSGIYFGRPSEERATPDGRVTLSSSSRSPRARAAAVSSCSSAVGSSVSRVTSVPSSLRQVTR